MQEVADVGVRAERVGGEEEEGREGKEKEGEGD